MFYHTDKVADISLVLSNWKLYGVDNVCELSGRGILYGTGAIVDEVCCNALDK